ncbi:hypothetical protein Aperf_G00000049640 [Anoplocephala perfoliata]
MNKREESVKADCVSETRPHRHVIEAADNTQDDDRHAAEIDTSLARLLSFFVCTCQQLRSSKLDSQQLLHWRVLEERIEVCRGSSKDIGNAIVGLLAKHLNPSECLGEVVVERFEAPGFPVKFFQLESDDAKGWRELVEFSRKDYIEGLNIPISNGRTIYKNDLTAPLGEEARVSSVNYYAASLQMCLEFARMMMKNSKVVNVPSLMGPMSIRGTWDEIARKFAKVSTPKTFEGLIITFVK